MKLLLISNSTMAGQPYLQYPLPNIKDFLGSGVKKVLFFPFAAVTFSYDEYEKKVQQKFAEIGIEVESIHHSKNYKKSVAEAEAFVVGGGNTFKLLKVIQQNDLIEVIRFRVLDGTPYVGWSAGSNVACPTICTTNDMPITEPDSLNSFNLIRFQINPHYLDSHPDGHGGETREERIAEFLEMDPDIYVAGLREGCMIRIEDAVIHLIGDKTMRIFKRGRVTREVGPSDDLDFLFE